MGYPSLPTMTVEEFYEQRYGQQPAPGRWAGRVCIGHSGIIILSNYDQFIVGYKSVEAYCTKVCTVKPV